MRVVVQFSGKRSGSISGTFAEYFNAKVTQLKKAIVCREL